MTIHFSCIHAYLICMILVTKGTTYLGNAFSLRCKTGVYNRDYEKERGHVTVYEDCFFLCENPMFAY